MPKQLPDMSLFTIIEEGQAILSDKGIYYQTDIYERGSQLFAAYGRGFVRLLSREHTTVPTVKWVAIEGVSYREQFDGPKRTGVTAGLQAAE